MHEIIHALIFLNKAIKEIYISKDLTSCFVYSTNPVSKMRYILIAIAPNIVLGIFPLLAGMLLKNILYPKVTLIIILTSFFSIITGIGDYYNIFNAVNQVPTGGYIFNSGLHSYWYGITQKQGMGRSNSLKALLVLFLSLGFVLLATKKEVCLIIFYLITIISTFIKNSFYTVFKWLSITSIIFANVVLWGFFRNKQNILKNYRYL